MHDSHPLKKRYDLERDKVEWLEARIRPFIPDWPLDCRTGFEYNSLYDFWRKSYYQKSRQLIRDYERLVGAVEVPEPYALMICDYHIYVQKPHQHDKNRYQSMIDNIPMESPVEPEEICHSIWQNKEVDLHDCSFQNIKKSHVFHSHHKMPMLRLEAFMSRWLGPLGYTMRMVSKGRGGGTEYVLGITHRTESASGFLEKMDSEGYRPYEEKQVTKPAKGKSTPAKAERNDLAAREQQLVQELSALRAQIEKSEKSNFST
ncbi:hypothetical protein [Pseudomonas amygdali]|uniref:Uncharacterized protein n=2 Tax=Pseudomonas amygdali pv. lachrymans TaxID=53707 RepID=A0AAD0M4E2_PSEAV|nr:hypothetical protein [Pseudomonas amygdali]AXH59598.1 hypothetical protein PLA107_030710 [Pseudomonas amygdali pv. lachrymans str. M301315]RMT06529.1 hypothetical protein ALP54_03521 [Pseudomonas amygdali pv. lachrymans]